MSTWVSKELAGPQHSSPILYNCLDYHLCLWYWQPHFVYFQCIFENFLCIMYEAWGDPKWAQNDLKFVVNVIITLENGIRHLLNIFEKLFYLGQFGVTLTLAMWYLKKKKKNALFLLQSIWIKVKAMIVMRINNFLNFVNQRMLYVLETFYVLNTHTIWFWKAETKCLIMVKLISSLEVIGSH